MPMFLMDGRRRAAAALALAASIVFPAVARSDAGVAGAPTTAVTFTVDGTRLVVLDTATGAEVRTLTTEDAGDISRVELSPDGSTAYYATAYEDGSVVGRIPIAGGTPEVLATGDAPAPSPDGRLLGYAYHPSDADPWRPGGIAVLDLVSGTERRFPGAAPQSPFDFGPPVQDITFAPDSRRLAFTNDDSGGSIFILDTASDSSLTDADELDPSHGYLSPTWLPDGRIAAVEFGAPDGRMMAVDPETHAAHELVPGVGHADRVDVDTTGKYLLFTQVGSEVNEGEGSSFIMVGPDGSRGEIPTPVHQYLLAVW